MTTGQMLDLTNAYHQILTMNNENLRNGALDHLMSLIEHTYKGFDPFVRQRQSRIITMVQRAHIIN